MSICKNKLPIAITALLFSGQLSASLAYQQQGIEDRLSAVESELADKRKVSPTVTTRNDFFVTGDYLLWHANEGGLAYAVKVDNFTTEKGRVKNLHSDWDSGFRVGIGYRIPHDKWELALTWTGFSTDAHGKTSTTTDLIFPELSADVTPFFPTSLVTSMSGRWKMRLNVLDGDISRYFMATKWLALRPHFGIRGAWIDQHYSAKLHGGALGGVDVVKDHLKIRNDFKGVGLRAGLDSEWDICKRWSIYGNAAYSLIYGHFGLRHHESVELTGASVLSTNENIKDSFQQMVSIAELAVGLRWDYTFSNNWVALRLQAGWEFNGYFGQNKFEHFDISSSKLAFIANHEDLTIQGFVLSGRLDF